MNKKSILIKSIALTSVFVLNMGLYMSLNRVAIELDAYSTTSLPTTIDLNDCDEEDIRSYYSDLNSLDSSERQGTNLLKNLKPILSNNQKYYSYDSGNAIWQLYEITDRDWAKSPASSTTYGTYNSVTNKITNYVYGTSNSSGKNNPYIHALYINRNVENLTKAWGNHQQDDWGINREHIWAKSHGFQDEGNGGARGDPMHLWAGNGYANNIHSNYFFGFVDTTRSHTNCGTKYSNVSGNLLGCSKNIGGSEKVFEPQDCDKGDIARAIFYMVARYNNYANEASGFSVDNPNLVLLNDLSQNRTTGNSTANNPYGMGLLRDLLAWNKLDPVDEYEIHRNNLLYRNYTNNRNPFIDFPSWADAIWGTADLDGTNYNPNVTTYASPSSDPISSESSKFDISFKNLNLQVNDQAVISGRNASSTITWTVGDNTVVSLDKNSTSNNEEVTITALKAGETTITATSGGDSVNCAVTVIDTNYGTLQNPLTVDEALDIIRVNDTNPTNEQLYVKGVVTSNSAFNTQYHNYDEIWLQNDLGYNAQALSLFRIQIDNSIEGDYSAADSMVGKEVIAYGYGLHYTDNGYNKYELCKANNKSPIIKAIIGPGVDDYLSNASPYLDLLGEESSGLTNKMDSVTFAGAGLNNGQDILDFAIGGITLNGAVGTNGGGNTPKYYNTGKAMRIYPGNTITFTCANNISEVSFTITQGSEDDLTASAGTLDGSTWTGNTSSVTFTSTASESHIRITVISVTYKAVGLTVENVALRFGVVIPKTDWNIVHNEWPITDYGVMLVKQTTLNNTYGVDTIEEAHENDYYLLDLNKGTYAEPWAMDEDNYAFSIKLNIKQQSNYDEMYCAAPYVIAGGEYYFFNQIETSVNDLATYYLSHSGSSLSNDALTLLSTLH